MDTSSESAPSVNPNGQFVPVKHLAHELGIDRSLCRKFILRLGIKPQKRRLADSRGSLALVVTEQEAAQVRDARQTHWPVGSQPVADSGQAGSGVFYVIQLVPELAPLRLKFGYARDAQQRLAEHRIAAPTATLLATWPCRPTWEVPAIDSLSAICRFIGGEVYECDSLDAVLDRAGAFFGLMPAPDQKRQLASCSPHNT